MCCTFDANGGALFKSASSVLRTCWSKSSRRSNSRRDRVDKLSLYAQYGVAEYWIVDPVERQFDFLVNRGGKFEVQPQQDNRYASPVCPELEIDLAEFWRSVDEELGTV